MNKVNSKILKKILIWSRCQTAGYKFLQQRCFINPERSPKLTKKSQIYLKNLKMNNLTLKSAWNYRIVFDREKKQSKHENCATNQNWFYWTFL